MTVSYLNDTDAGAVDPADAQGSDARPGPREELARYAELGGFTLTADTHPWYAAADAISTPEDARAASTVLAELRSRDVPATRAAVLALVAEGSLDEPDTVIGLSLVVGVLQRVHGTSAKLRAEAYAADLDALTAATADSRWRKEQGVKLSWGQRRSLRAQAKTLVVGKRGRRADLHEALAAAAAARTDWAALSSSSSSGAVRPAVPTDATQLAEVVQAVEALGQAVRALGRLLPGSDLEAAPLTELGDLVDRLAADEGTLYRLPNLRTLRAGLTERGLDSLVDELTESRADREAALAAYDREVGVEAAEAEAEGGASAEDDDVAEAEDVAAARQALAGGPRAEAVVPAEEPAPVASEAPADEDTEAAAEETPAVELDAEVEVPVAEAVPVEVEAEEPVAEVEVEAELAAEAEVEVEAELAAEAEVEVEAEPAAEAEAEVEVEAAEPGPAVEVEAATEVAAEVVPVVEADVAEAEAEAESSPRVRRPKKPAITPGRAVTAYTPDELTAVVRWIDSDAVERTDDELLRAAMKELGFARLGPRIKEALGAAVSEVRG